MNPLKNTSLISKGKITIWKPIRDKRKPKTTLPLIHKYSATLGSWAKSDKEKELFAEHLYEVFYPHNKRPGNGKRPSYTHSVTRTP